jgi:hypothetical protein
MAQGNAGSLATYNNELVACIEDLREKREELNRSILRDEEEKAKIQKVRRGRRSLFWASEPENGARRRPLAPVVDALRETPACAVGRRPQQRPGSDSSLANGRCPPLFAPRSLPVDTRRSSAS